MVFAANVAFVLESQNWPMYKRILSFNSLKMWHYVAYIGILVNGSI